MSKFSPAAGSPGTKISHQKNLTGNPRLIKDSAAEIHSSIQRWNGVHLHGFSILKNITEIKNDETFCEDLEYLCEELSKDCDKLDEIVSDLERCTVRLKALRSLQDGDSILFQTWSVGRFGQTAEIIHEAYKEEARVRRKILENVAHDYGDSWKMLHLAAWVRQIKIHDGVTTALESMLVETGHR